MTRKRALVVAPRFPLPQKSGEQMRIFNTLKRIADEFETTLIAVDENDEGESESLLEELGITVHTIPVETSLLRTAKNFVLTGTTYQTAKIYNTEIHETATEVLDGSSYDLVWVHSLGTLPLLPVDLPSPTVLDTHASEFEFWEKIEQSGSLIERIGAKANKRRIVSARNRLQDRIDIVLAVSEGEAREATDWTSGVPVWTVPNGIDVDRYSTTDPVTGDDVLFVGSLDRKRNVEAVTWFVHNAWDDVRAEHPQSEFKIVGRSPSEAVEALDTEAGVDVVGEVPDVEPYYHDCGVVVAPFSIGAGTMLKTLEALAIGSPLVTTSRGAAGIDIVNGKHALVRGRGDSFTDAVIELLSDHNKRRSLSASGVEFVTKNYSWDRIMEETLADIRSHVDRDG